MVRYTKSVSLIALFILLFIPSVLANLNEERFDYLIKEKAEKYGVDEHLVKAIIRVESCFEAKAISKKGDCKGLMQLSPYAVKEYGVRNVFSPAENIEGGVRYLAYLSTLFDSEYEIIAAYNAGEEKIAKGKFPKSTQKYVVLVLTFKSKYEKEI